MRIVRDWSHCPSEAQNAVVALGNFEGLHRGHQALLGKTKELAERLGAPCAVMTFEPHPREFFNPECKPLRIYPLSTKIRLLAEYGVSVLYICRFNKALSSMHAETFISDVLVNSLKVRHAVTGDNFVFGARRSGDAEFLEKKAGEHGFGYSRIIEVTDGDETCSSTHIRAALKSGDIAAASHMLGRPYSIEGRVLHGDGRGKGMGYPTANLRVGHIFHPAHGVYAVRMSLPGMRAVHGVANLGVRPTFGGGAPVLEAHCLEEAPSLYGRRLKVELVQYLRAEQKFDSQEALVNQIRIDVEHARKILADDERKRA